MIAKDRDSNRRDLFEAIERGDYPRWLMQVQIMTEEEARRYRINPVLTSQRCGITKIFPCATSESWS